MEQAVNNPGRGISKRQGHPIRPVSHVTGHRISGGGRQESTPPLVKSLSLQLVDYIFAICLAERVPHHDCQDSAEFPAPRGVGKR